MDVYQLWAHSMFPKGDFSYTVQRVEAVCRKRLMEVSSSPVEVQCNTTDPSLPLVACMINSALPPLHHAMTMRPLGQGHRRLVATQGKLVTASRWTLSLSATRRRFPTRHTATLQVPRHWRKTGVAGGCSPTSRTCQTRTSCLRCGRWSQWLRLARARRRRHVRWISGMRRRHLTRRRSGNHCRLYAC